MRSRTLLAEYLYVLHCTKNEELEMANKKSSTCKGSKCKPEWDVPPQKNDDDWGHTKRPKNGLPKLPAKKKSGKDSLSKELVVSALDIFNTRFCR